MPALELRERVYDPLRRVCLGFGVPENWITDTPAAKRLILARLDGWNDALRGFIANADTPLTPRRINALPV